MLSGIFKRFQLAGRRRHERCLGSAEIGAGEAITQRNKHFYQEVSMKKKVLSSLVLSGAVLVMAPQAWSQAGGAAGSGSRGASESGSGSQVQRPSDSGVSGQQRGTSSELQSERGSGMQSQRGMGQRSAAGQQRLSKDQVKQIQEALKDKGQDPGQADGIMGPKTQQALRQFQKSQNLQVTGRVDQQTASALGVDVSGAAGSGAASSGSGMGSSRESSGVSGAGERGSSSAPGKASSREGTSGSSSGLSGGSSSGTSTSGATGRAGNPDITEPKKGSTAGRQESTDANPK
jgi:peptidoglycan hydrolase-like protein with peptidoglycan-binding domain